MKTALNIGLALVAIGLAIWLGWIIYVPIKFEKVHNERTKAVKDKLTTIRDMQMAYKKTKGEFAENFVELINFVKYDSIIIVKVVGNPDDTTVVTRFDTSFIPAKDSIKPAYALEDLPYIPYSKGKKFDLYTAQRKVGVAEVPIYVLEILARKKDILFDQDPQMYDTTAVLKIGSRYDATYDGNWR